MKKLKLEVGWSAANGFHSYWYDLYSEGETKQNTHKCKHGNPGTINQLTAVNKCRSDQM